MKSVPMSAKTGQPGRSTAARRDMALIIGISLAAAVVCMRFDVSEALIGWARQHERFQLDELPGVLLVFATCLIWFSSRRHLEARHELGLRRRAEVKLAHALGENQHLAQQYADLQELERKALARDLHDELGQYLNVIKLDAVALRDVPTPPAAVTAAAHAIIDSVDRIYGVVASLIRQLRPVGFDELGVVAALEHCVNEWRVRLPDTCIELTESAFGELDEARALALFRLVQEALTNVARHADATRVGVHIAGSDAEGRNVVTVTVEDNGRGADMTAPRAGLGLVGMRERIAALGGSLQLASRAGGGFKITAVLPQAGGVRLPAAAEIS